MRHAGAATDDEADGRLAGTGLLFAGYLFLVADTYLGLAGQLGIVKALHLMTLLAWGLFAAVLLKTGTKALSQFRQNKLLFGFVLFTGFSIAVAFVHQYAFEAFRKHFDYFGLFVMTAYLVDRPSRVRKLAATASLTAVVLVARNLDKLTSTVRQSGFVADPTFMGDGNDFAWGLTVMLPFAVFLVVGPHRLYLRALGFAGLVAALFTVVGTQSRGATVAVGVAGLVYILFIAKRRAVALTFAATLVIGGLLLAPDSYTERVGTISSFETDNSALGRLQAWKAAVVMAFEHPLGVGADNFNSAYGRDYLPRQTTSMIAWGQNRWISPHSIYFRALAEYGFLGLILLLTIIGTNFVDNLRVRAAVKDDPGFEPSAFLMPGLAAMAVAGHAVGGVFLGGLTYPHLHLLTGLTAAMRRRLALPVAATAPEPAAGQSKVAPRVRRLHPTLAARAAAHTPQLRPSSGRGLKTARR